MIGPNIFNPNHCQLLHRLYSIYLSCHICLPTDPSIHSHYIGCLLTQFFKVQLSLQNHLPNKRPWISIHTFRCQYLITTKAPSIQLPFARPARQCSCNGQWGFQLPPALTANALDPLGPPLHWLAHGHILVAQSGTNPWRILRQSLAQDLLLTQSDSD